MKNNFVFLTVISVILLGASVFFRKLAVDRLHPNQLQIVAGFVYTFAIPVWWYFLRRSGITHCDSMGIFWGLLCVVTSTASAVLLSHLLKNSDDPSVVAMAVATNPLVVLALSTIFLDESLTIKKILGCIVTIGGIILLT